MESVFWLFPIVFMIHEMEEIIGFRLWFEKNFDLGRTVAYCTASAQPSRFAEQDK